MIDGLEWPFSSPFTEGHGVLSCCMVLTALLRFDAKRLLLKRNWSKICLALIAESVARCCKTQLRSSSSTKTAAHFIKSSLTPLPSAAARSKALGLFFLVLSTGVIVIATIFIN